MFNTKILFSILLLFLTYQASAQEEYYDIEEPEEFVEEMPVEPYYEEMENVDIQVPPPEGLPRPDQEKRPTFNLPRGNNRGANRANNNNNRVYTPSSGDIQFRLVDPPLYWVGEKRPNIPKAPK